MITYRKYLCSEVDCIMDAVIKIVQYTCANAMNHHQFMELLKEIEDNEVNDHIVFANVHYLSHEFYKDILYC